MNRYTVKIINEVSLTVEVSANSESEAKEKAKEYAASISIMDWTYDKTDYSVLSINKQSVN